MGLYMQVFEAFFDKIVEILQIESVVLVYKKIEICLRLVLQVVYCLIPVSAL